MRSRWWIMVLTIFFAAGLTVGLRLWLGSSPPRIAYVALATEIDPVTKAPLAPVEHFPSGTKVMYAVVRVSDPRQGTRVESRWYYDRQGTGRYALVDSSFVTLPDRRDRNVAFRLTAEDTFPAGAYKVAILMDGQPAVEREFQVR